MAKQYRNRFVMLDLLEGWDWFESSLQRVLRASGFRPLNKSQAMMMTYISAGVTRPTEIAKKMRLSRQAVGHIYKALIARGILIVRDDPTDARSIILGFPKSADKIRGAAANALNELEAELQKRIGQKKFDNMRDALDLEWGPTSEQVEMLSNGN